MGNEAAMKAILRTDAYSQKKTQSKYIINVSQVISMNMRKMKVQFISTCKKQDSYELSCNALHLSLTKLF